MNSSSSIFLKHADRIRFSYPYMYSAEPFSPTVTGSCYVMCAYDVGLQIDLDVVARVLANGQRVDIAPRQRAPKHFEFRRKPLRLPRAAKSHHIGAHESVPEVDIIIYEFGSISVTYRIPFEGPLSDLLVLSDLTYESKPLLDDSRAHVEEIVRTIEKGIGKPRISNLVEDYAIFALSDIAGERATLSEMLVTHRETVAQILRSETQPLSPQEIEDATAEYLSYTPHDAVIINWNAAFMIGQDAEDVRAVLEFANVQLLELRYLDRQLDRALDQSYETLSRRQARAVQLTESFADDLKRVAELQVESAILFEGVSNALKLLGDQYLSRVYRSAARRLYLADWDRTIVRKLSVLQSIYEKLEDRISTIRMQIMELAIIVLILISIVLPFFISSAK